MLDFKERAKLLGVSPDTDFRGVIRIESLERLIEILTDQKEPKSGELLFAGIAPVRDNLTLQLSRKLVEHIYCGQDLSDGDRAAVDTAFPLDVNVISIPEKTISTEWNLNEETPTGLVLVSVGTLTINDGGTVTIANRQLDLTVDHLVRNGTALPGGRGEFNILGIDGAQGTKPDAAKAPGQAGSGNPGNCSSAGIAGAAGEKGTPGEPGSKGAEGGKGGGGKPSLPAIMRFTTSVTATGRIKVLTHSGAGGKGGEGGQGSMGGQGGNGGNGVTCGCTGNAGGSGASGGRGGTGGTGGPGGNGADAEGNIIVWVPANAISKFDSPVRLPAHAGEGGDPGLRGEGGAGGKAGSGGKHNDGGSAGGPGAVGDPGTRGPDGQHNGTPAEIYILPPP